MKLLLTFLAPGSRGDQEGVAFFEEETGRYHHQLGGLDRELFSPFIRTRHSDAVPD